MARPCQPFDQSLRSAIMRIAEQHAKAHNGRLPTRYRLWRELRAQGHRCAVSTLYWHWEKLVATSQIIYDDGMYWLPNHQPQPPRRPMRRATGTPSTLQMAMF
jgi:hypothetical protein